MFDTDDLVASFKLQQHDRGCEGRYFRQLWMRSKISKMCFLIFVKGVARYMAGLGKRSRSKGWSSGINRTDITAEEIAVMSWVTCVRRVSRF